MKIGIDARLIAETGVGRYIRNLIRELGKSDDINQYIVYLRPAAFESFEVPNSRWQKRLAKPRWHTLHEQIVMPFLFMKDRLDLLHVPYFNIPILYPGKCIVTIHDLTILHFMTGKATMLPYPLYRLKKFGYRIALQFGLGRAAAIITPSETTKIEIIDHFHIPSEKIHVTYEGFDENLSKKGEFEEIPDVAKTPYFLYVGNAYPHKNLEALVEAFGMFVASKKEFKSYRLILVGKDDFFYARLKKDIERKKLESSIHFFGYADDKTLRTLYAHAKALIFPSLMEGFGLPALEALSLRVPIICSDIPIFHEILDGFPLYIDPNNTKDIEKSFMMILGMKKSTFYKNEEALQSLLEKYSWTTMGNKTIALYKMLGKGTREV